MKELILKASKFLHAMKNVQKAAYKKEDVNALKAEFARSKKDLVAGITNAKRLEKEYDLASDQLCKAKQREKQLADLQHETGLIFLRQSVEGVEYSVAEDSSAIGDVVRVPTLDSTNESKNEEHKSREETKRIFSYEPG